MNCNRYVVVIIRCKVSLILLLRCKIVAVTFVIVKGVVAVCVLKWLFQTWLKIPGQKFSQSKLWSSESIGHLHTSELYLWNTVVQASPACLSLCKAMMVLVMMVQQYTRAGENSVPSGQQSINFGTCPWTIVYSPYKQRFKLVCRFRGGLTKSQSDLIAKAFPKENQTHDIPSAIC